MLTLPLERVPHAHSLAQDLKAGQTGIAARLTVFSRCSHVELFESMYRADLGSCDSDSDSGKDDLEKEVRHRQAVVRERQTLPCLDEWSNVGCYLSLSLANDAPPLVTSSHSFLRFVYSDAILPMSDSRPLCSIYWARYTVGASASIMIVQYCYSCQELGG
jgi:hypothetical protein